MYDKDFEMIDELIISKEYGIPEEYRSLAKFSEVLIRNIRYGEGFDEPYGDSFEYDFPRIIFYDEYNTNREGEVKNYELAGYIEDIIVKGDCKALVVRNDFFSGGKSNYCIHVIYYNDLNNKVAVWTPTFRELFEELAKDTNIENPKQFHYKIIREISNKLTGMKDEEKKQFNVSEIVDKYCKGKWIIKVVNEFPLDARVYYSAIKSIMISEDIKYKHGRGRKRVVEAYKDLNIDDMPLEKWIDKYRKK